MKTVKRMLSLVLALVLAFSMTGLTALAETVEPGEENVTLGESAPVLGESENAPAQGENPPAGQVSAPASNSAITGEAALVQALEAGGSLALGADVALSTDVTISGSVETELDLAGKTLTMTRVQIMVTGGASLKIKNGSIHAQTAASNTAVISVQAGSSVELDGVTFTTTGAALFPAGNAAHVTVRNSNIEAGAYAVATNANTTANHYVQIDLFNSIFKGYSPVFINVPGTLKMDECTVEGTMHGVVVRGGTADIQNSSITLDYSDADAGSMANYFATRNWGSGNMVNLAALTIGNKAGATTAYDYPSYVTLRNTRVLLTGTYGSSFPAVYAWANLNTSNGVTLFYDEDCTFGGELVYGDNGRNIKAGMPAASLNEQPYHSLAEAVAAAETGETVYLLRDLADIGQVTLAKDIILDGQNHKLTGNSNLYVEPQGATIQNLVFEKIHNNTALTASQKSRYNLTRDYGSLTAIYASDLTGTLKITGCTFDSVDWDAIQTTPVAGATVTIQNNIFRNTHDYEQIRYIHVESDTNVDFSAKINGNRIYDGSTLKETGLEVYYFADESKVDLSGNYIAEPTACCILKGSGTNVPSKIFPLLAASDSTTADKYQYVRVRHSGNDFYFDTLSQAAAFMAPSDSICLEGEGITIALDDDVTLPDGKVLSINSGVDLVLDLNGHTLEGNKASKYDGVLSVNSGGKLVILDSSAEQTGAIVNHNTTEGKSWAVLAYSSGNLTIQSGTFEGATGGACACSAASVLTIEDGRFGGALSVSGHASATGSITGGYYTNSPKAEYLAAGYADIPSTDATYVRMVVNVAPVAQAIEAANTFLTANGQSDLAALDTSLDEVKSFLRANKETLASIITTLDGSMDADILERYLSENDAEKAMIDKLRKAYDVACEVVSLATQPDVAGAASNATSTEGATKVGNVKNEIASNSALNTPPEIGQNNVRVDSLPGANTASVVYMSVSVSLENVQVNETTAEIPVEKLVYEVQPQYQMDGGAKQDLPNENITRPITFRLAVPRTVANPYACVSHPGDDDRYCEIQTDASGDKYVEISSRRFSPFTITFVDTIPSADTSSSQEEFWSGMISAIEDASSGDVLKVNAGSYDKVPASVMSALREQSGVGMVLSFAGGKTVTIPAGRALAAETGRVYYPAEELATLFAGAQLKDPATGKPVDSSSLNPGTGGFGTVVEITAPVVGADVPKVPADIQPSISNRDTAPEGTVVPVVSAQEQARAGSNGWFAVAAAIVLLAGAAIALFFYFRANGRNE